MQSFQICYLLLLGVSGALFLYVPVRTVPEEWCTEDVNPFGILFTYLIISPLTFRTILMSPVILVCERILNLLIFLTNMNNLLITVSCAEKPHYSNNTSSFVFGGEQNTTYPSAPTELVAIKFATAVRDMNTLEYQAQVHIGWLASREGSLAYCT